MHNNFIADNVLSKDLRFKEGETIKLSASDVHSFGLKARMFSMELWNSATNKYLNCGK